MPNLPTQAIWIFLTLFILVGAGMICAFFSSVAGRTEVGIYNSQGTVFTGIGPFGRTRRFDASEVSNVGELDAARTGRRNAQPRTSIVLETRAGKKIRFGSMLDDERRDFLLAALRKAIR